MTPAFGSQQFRTALSSYPTGVVIVCADSPAGPVGMTCNSFTAVSLDPPLVAICPAQASSTWPLIRAAGRFCVSILSARAEQIGTRFARRDADRFTGTHVHARSHGPAISDALAWLDCDLYDEFPAGDHSIAVGRVIALDQLDEQAAPLVFWHSAYRTITHATSRADTTDPLDVRRLTAALSPSFVTG